MVRCFKLNHSVQEVLFCYRLLRLMQALSETDPQNIFPNSPFRQTFSHIRLHLVRAVSCGDNEILNYISLVDGASVSRGQRIIPGCCVMAEAPGN